MKLHPLRQKRLESGLSQYQVAFETGIPQVRISYAERGFPALTKAQKLEISKFFDTPERELFPEPEGGVNHG